MSLFEKLHTKRQLALLLIIPGIAILLASLWVNSALAEDGEDDPVPVPITDRLAAPPMPSNPDQADYGAQVYYQVCMACHGDKGQGLTEEWRVEWEEDSNCWQSKCHATNHPPQGFDFPTTCCTAVIGPNSLIRFRTAQDLYIYLVDTMPWWNPGYLKSEEYWQLTAYLLRAHNSWPQGVVLSETNSAVFPVNLQSPPPSKKQNEAVLVSFVLISAAGVLFLQQRLSH